MMAGKGRERRKCLSCGEGFKRLSANRMHATPQERKAERQVVISCYDGWEREGKKELPVMWRGF
jgi:hypothetical protein